MKNALRMGLMGIVFLSTGAMAQDFKTEEAWVLEDRAYEELVKTLPEANLVRSWTKQMALGVLACGFDATIIAATVSADTLPVLNGLAEAMAHAADENYVSIESDDFLGKTWEVFKGAFGGIPALTKDSLEFVILYMSGEEERAWQSVAKAYESTITVTNSLMADKAVCPQLNRKEVIARTELYKRWGVEGAEDQESFYDLELNHP